MNLETLSEATVLAQGILDAEPRTTVLSIDPGGDSDHAGIVLLTYDAQANRYTRRYLCQRLVRLPLHLGYEALEGLVVDAYRDVVRARDASYWTRWAHVGPSKRPPLGKVIALVERNGTGRGLIEALRRQGLEVVDVWTSGGTGYRTEGAQFSVALVELIKTLLRTWGSHRLLFADMAEAEIQLFEQECRDYEHHLTLAGRSTYRSRAGTHDDVLRALAQGIAWCEHGQPAEVRMMKLTGL